MANLTIDFSIPVPPSTSGYIVSYRPKGTTVAYNIVHTTTSPVVIPNVEKKDYEGFIQSDCGDGTLGPQIPFEAILPPMSSLNGTLTPQCINTYESGGGQQQGYTVLKIGFTVPPNRDIKIQFGYCQAGGGVVSPACYGADLITNPPSNASTSYCPSGFTFTIPAGTFEYVTPILFCSSGANENTACLRNRAFTNIYMKVLNYPNLILNFTPTQGTFTQIY